MSHAPHTLEAQLAHLKCLIRKRQEQLANDQSDIDFALTHEPLPTLSADQRGHGFRVSMAHPKPTNGVK